MKQDLIIDAMEFIDQDIIEETDALRRQESTRKKVVNIRWHQIALIAAAVCLVFVGIGALIPKGGKGAAMDGFVDEGLKDEINSNLGENVGMLIRIDQWLEDGFIGTVVENGGQLKAVKGESIKVEIVSDTSVDMDGCRNYVTDATFGYKDVLNLYASNIKEGTVVTVAYVDFVSNDEENSVVSGVTGTGPDSESQTSCSIKALIITEESVFYE